MKCPRCGLVFDEKYGVCRDCGWIAPKNNTYARNRSVNSNVQRNNQVNHNNYKGSQNNLGSGNWQNSSVNYSNGDNNSNNLKIIIPCVIAAIVIIGIIVAVFICGSDNDKKGSESPKGSSETTVYTAEELASKSLEEIVELMDYDFEIDTDGNKLVWYTSPSVFIYNYDELPGFVFYIDEAADDWDNDDENLNEVKSKIIDGEYENFSFIALFDDAKLDDDISADMDYSGLTEYLGDFECEWSNDVVYSPNDECNLLFPAEHFNDIEHVNIISADVMEEYNPNLKTIIVYPGFESEYKTNTDSAKETTEEEITTEKETTTERETTTKKESTTQKTSKKLIFASMPEHFTFTSGAGGWRTYFDLEDDGSFKGEYTDSNVDETYICKFTGKFTEPKKLDKYTYVMELDYLNYEKKVGEIYYENGIKYITADAYGFDDPDKFYIYLPGKPKNETPSDFLSWSFIDQMLTVLPRFFYGIYNEGGREGFTACTDDCAWYKTYVCELENGNVSEFDLSYTGNSMLILKNADGKYIDSLPLGAYSLFESEAELGECIVTSKTGDTYGIWWEFTSGYDEITLSICNYSENGLPDWGVGDDNDFEGVYIS